MTKPSDKDIQVKALVVDDSSSGRLLLTHILEHMGCEVTTAKNGQEALELFDPEQTDVVFIDIEMPVLNGIDATRLIRQRLSDRFIPIIFVTAGDSTKYLDACLEAGGDDFINKPFNFAVLSAKTRSLLRLKKLYAEQLKQKKEILDFKAVEDSEHEAAASLYENIVGAGYMESPNIHSILSPMAKFNGDIFLCAYTPADKLHVLLGDFTGHGITASLASSPAAEIFYGMTAKGFGIREITEEINLKLKKLLPVNMFLATTLACLDRNTHNLSVITCGLPDHFLFCKKTGRIQTVPSNNLPLGIINSTDLNLIEKNHHVSSSQHLIMFTDGIIEAENQAGAPFGFKGVKGCLRADRHSCFDDILFTLDQHQGEQGQQDDITLVRLSCDFSPEKWALYQNTPQQVDMKPSSWKTSSTMDSSTLKRLNPVPTLVNSLMEIQGLMPFRESIFLLVTELFVNSLDHGLLHLDSSLKSSAEGFAKYFELKQQRLDLLSTGSIKFIFSHEPYGNGGILTIRVQDSGRGFDEKALRADLTANQAFSGRGIELIRQTCESLHYSDNGSSATATFIWQQPNDH